MYGGSHRKQAEFGSKRLKRICLKNIVRRAAQSRGKFFSFNFGKDYRIRLYDESFNHT